MKHLLSDIEPAELWDHFYKLSQIPHASGNERGICRYVHDLALSLGVEVAMDASGGEDFGNVLVRLPASTGFERAPLVILQSHLDMVALPAERKDLPLELFLDGSVLRARGSTLGADNGIAVAMALTLMTSPDIVHGPMELFFTVNEEAGMTGVIGLSDKMLNGRILINADSQEEEILTVGCAGVNRSIFKLPINMEPAPADLAAIGVSIVGGRGGHSGLEIDSGRANAGQLLIRVLHEEAKAFPMRLSDVNWGTVDNAIPSEAHAVLFIRPSDVEGLNAALTKWSVTIVSEFGGCDGDLRITSDVHEPPPPSAMDEATTRKVFSFLLAMPHGVQAMSRDVDGIVETSANVAVARTSPEAVTVNVSQRSLSDPALDSIVLKCESVGILAGAEVAQVGKAYGWKPNMASPLLGLCKDAYRKVFGREPKVTGLHGMLECGIIKAKYPDMDMISFGPTILDAHAVTKPDYVSGRDADSTGERIDTARMPLFWEFAKTVLRRLAESGG